MSMPLATPKKTQTIKDMKVNEYAMKTCLTSKCNMIGNVDITKAG